jgi:non-ribosomal peptide synthetase component F
MLEVNRAIEAEISASQSLQEREYWLNKLSGQLEKSFFYYDRQKSDHTQPQLHSVKFKWTGKLFSRLKRLSKDTAPAMYMILAAGLTALLYKYSGNDDIIIGAPIYKQDTDGEFINTVLALRNRVNGNMTFKELLLEVRETVIEATKYQNYPLDTLLYDLNLPVTEKECPLFDTVILVETIHDKKYTRDLSVKVTFCFAITNQDLEGVMEYDSFLYSQAAAARIAVHYQQLLETALGDMDAPLRQVTVLSEQEKNQLLEEFNDTRAEFPSDKTLHELIELQVEKSPDKIAQEIEDQSCTYRELNRYADGLAAVLEEKGVKRDTIVGIHLEQSITFITALIAVLKAGGAYLPLDITLPP